MESRVFLLGNWKNFDDLEDSLSLPELECIIVSLTNKENEQREFTAALKGIDLKGEQLKARRKEIEQRAFAKMGEQSQNIEDVGFDILGIEYIEEEDE